MQGAFLYHSGQKYRAVVAQLVEQGPLKPKVLGSIPSRSTIKNIPHTGMFFILQARSPPDNGPIPSLLDQSKPSSPLS